MNHVEVYEGKDQQWYWRRRSSNGEIIATGEGYTRTNDAIEGAKANFPADKLDVLEPPEDC